MSFSAKLYFKEEAASAGRVAERRPLQAEATVRDETLRPIDVTIVDLSSSGCLIEGAGEIQVPSVVNIGIGGIGRISARVVRREGQRYGCSFLVPLSEETVSLASAVDTVVSFPAAAFPTPASFGESSMPDPSRWPRPVRTTVVIGGAILTWAVVLAFLL